MNFSWGSAGLGNKTQALILFVAKCGDPIPPTNGMLFHEAESSSLNYWCNGGYRPSANMTSICDINGYWVPAPHLQICTLVVGEVEM